MRECLALLLLLAVSSSAPAAFANPLLPDDASMIMTKAAGAGVHIASVASVSLTAGGRVEVQMGGRLGTICSTGFTVKEARVVCAQSGLTGGAVRAATKTFLPSLVSQLKCIGNETSLAACKFVVTKPCSAPPAGVTCKPPAVLKARLVIDSGPFGTPYGAPTFEDGSVRGRLEVTLTNFNEGTVCDTGFGDQEAQVVCRMLGMVGGRALKGAAYGPGKTPVRLNRVQCTGGESSLSQCKYNTDVARCTHANDVSVECRAPPNMPTRLAGGKNGNEGRLEVQMGGRWGTVCHELFTVTAAQVACKSMGLLGGRVIRNPTFSSASKRPVLVTKVRCSGKEDKLSACSFSTATSRCSHARDVGIVCQRPPIVNVEILNGTKAGFVVAYVALPTLNMGNYEPGTICSTGFNDAAAKVVCKKLGFIAGRAAPSLAEDPVDIAGYEKVVRNFVCKGYERDLSACQYDRITPCRSKRSARVQCTDAPVTAVRLVGGALSGRLEVKLNNKWGAICNVDFGREEAVVACKQLGKKGGVVVEYKGDWMPAAVASMTCTGREASLNACEYTTSPQGGEEFGCFNGGYYGGGEPVAIRCTA